MFRRPLSAALSCAVALVGSSSRAQPAPAKGGDDKLAERLDAQQADITDQDARIKDLEKKLSELRSMLRDRDAKATVAPLLLAPAAEPSTTPGALPPPPVKHFLPSFLGGLSVTGYVQAQYESHQDSLDDLRQGGTLLNQDRFVLRRARIKLEQEWRYASFMAEVDGNTVKGPAFGFQHAEASLLWRGEKATSTPPILQLTMGLFDTPFGYELVESPRTRYFTERSTLSRAFFPGEPDLGVRLSSRLGWFRAAVAVMNGEPLNEKSGYGLRDPVGAKQIVARVGADFAPAPSFTVAAGVSMLNSNGFHPGADATKSTVQWKDINENGQIDPGELVSLPATSATFSQKFERWAVAGDLRLGWESRLGWTRAFAEVTLGSNMDRGLFVADPIVTSIDSRELGFTVGATQDITRYGVIGFRFDSYDPNADAQDRQGGKLLPTSQTIRTFSPLVGLVLPDRARLIFQYDVVRDFLGRDASGVPADLKNDAWTLRLQVQL